jgi:hypothetical protein
MSAAVATAHMPIPPTPEVWEGSGRLFVADNGTDSVLAVDLPSGNVTARISVPAHTMQLGVSPDSSTVVAIRGRDTDRQLVTFIDAAVEGDGLRLPHVSRTLDLGTGMYGVHDGELEQLWGRNLLIAENQAIAYLYPDSALDPALAFDATEFPLAYPDHLHIVDEGDAAWIAYLANGVVELTDQAGEVLASVACPAAHGAVRDEATGLGVFACMTDVAVVNESTEVARLTYPEEERIGGFLETDAGLVGYSEGVTGLHKVDVAAGTIDRVEIGGELYRTVVSDDGEHVLALLESGELEVRSAETLDLERSIAVSRQFPPLHETTSGAIMPDIVVSGSTAYVSLPDRGLIAEVNWETGEVVRNLRVGGMPTRMVLVAR